MANNNNNHKNEKKHDGGKPMKQAICLVTSLNHINRIPEQKRSIVCLALQKAIKDKLNKPK